MNTKTCTKCCQMKHVSEFPVEKGKTIARCRICTNAQKAEYKRKKREEHYRQRIVKGEVILPNDPINNHVCDYCHIEQPKALFRYNRRKCLECEKADGRAYRQSEIGKKKSLAWVRNNRERMAELQAQWYQNNKNKRNLEYNQRYHSDPLFRFQRNCKSRIHSAFRDRKLNKSDKTIKYLNCTIPHLAEWFVFSFHDERMTIDNHGTYWHIDHVIPINKFDLTKTDDICLCFNWINLSPLEGSENISKHDTISIEQIKRHVQKLVDFLYNNNCDQTSWILLHSYISLCARHLIMTGNSLELYLPLLPRNG